MFSGGASLEAAERVCAGDAVEQEQVLELLTSLTEKSLLLSGVESAPRYRMLGTIKEYAANRLAEAGEANLARQAHLAYFTELTETAEPHLRRAEQVEWLDTLEAEHDNITSAMRDAIAAGDAQAAMRLAAGAGWYWWLSGHRAEGMELLTAATEVPGEVTDEIRALVYSLVVLFVSSGRGDEHEAAEWIHKAHQFGQRGQQPATGSSTRWNASCRNRTRSCPRSNHCWTMRTPGYARWPGCSSAGCGSCPARAAGTRTSSSSWRSPSSGSLGERFGISFALTELAERMAVRGELAGACEHYEQAIAVLLEVGASDDVIRMRSRQAQLYWLLGDDESSAAAIAEAQRCAERVTWPHALAELALAKADLARWRGDAEEARHQVGVATTMLGDEAEQANIRVVTHDLLGYVADDLSEARAHRAAAYQAASEGGHAPVIAQVLVGVADLALRRDQHEQAARLLAASAERARAAGSLPSRRGPDRADRPTPPRRRTVRRGGAGGHADELGCSW